MAGVHRAEYPRAEFHSETETASCTVCREPTQSPEKNPVKRFLGTFTTAHTGLGVICSMPSRREKSHQLQTSGRVLFVVFVLIVGVKFLLD